MAYNDPHAAPVEIEFYAEAEHLVDVRRLVERLAGKTDLNRDQLMDLLTAVDEAVANAIRHGSPQGARSLVKVICHVLPSGLIVEVRDSGTGFTVPHSSRMPGPDSIGGRGLPLMIVLADSVEISATRKGTIVTLKKMIRA